METIVILQTRQLVSRRLQPTTSQWPLSPGGVGASYLSEAEYISHTVFCQASASQVSEKHLSRDYWHFCFPLRIKLLPFWDGRGQFTSPSTHPHFHWYFCSLLLYSAAVLVVVGSLQIRKAESCAYTLLGSEHTSPAVHYLISMSYSTLCRQERSSSPHRPLVSSVFAVVSNR